MIRTQIDTIFLHEIYLEENVDACDCPLSLSTCNYPEESHSISVVLVLFVTSVSRLMVVVLLLLVWSLIKAMGRKK